MNCRGRGVPPSPATAVAWLRVFGRGFTQSFWLSKRAAPLALVLEKLGSLGLVETKPTP